MGVARGGAARSVRRASVRLSLALVAGLCVLTASRAGALDARIAWRPVPNVAGYRLYLRLLGQSFGSGVDLGLLSADPDGIIRYVTHGLPLGITNIFALTAYNAAGRESAFSNELSLLVIGTPSGPAATPTPPATASRTWTASPTASRTSTATRTNTPVATRTATPTATPSATFTGPRYAVGGQVTYYATGQPVPDTTLTMQSWFTTMTASTDNTGTYGFPGANVGDWQLQPDKVGDVNNGVSALDAAWVLQRIAGTRDFNDLQTLACEVTGNGSLSSLDAVRILEYTVGDIANVAVATSCGTDWGFIPQPLLLPGEQVTLPLVSATSCQPGSISFSPLTSAAPQQDFIAVLFGDCTGNWDTSAGGALRVLAPNIRARLDGPRERPGGRWLVELHVDDVDSLEALEAHLAYDRAAATLEDVHAVGVASEALLYYRDDTSGVVSLAMASAQPLATGTRPLLVLVFSADSAPQVRLLDTLANDEPVGLAE